MKTFIGIASIFILVNCSGKNDTIQFESSSTLSGHPIDDITVYTKGNVYLNVIDTFLVIATASDAPFLRIYSTNSHKLQREFGRVGNGPMEFQSVNPLGQTGFDTANNSPILYIHDFKSNKIAAINFKKLIAEEEDFSTFIPPINNVYLTFIHYWDEKGFVGTPSSGGNLFIYDDKKKEGIVVPYLPKLDFSLSNELFYSSIYRPAVLVNREKGLIAAAPLFLGEVDYFDFEGNLLYASVFEARDAYKKELTSGPPYNNLKQQIVSMDTNGELIYALNSNLAAKDYDKLKRDSKIQVFDWDGNAIIEYNLDGRPLQSFAVDDIHNRIYAYDPNEEVHNIVMYDLE